MPATPDATQPAVINPPADEPHVAFMSGTVMAIEDVPDEMFAGRMLGDGIAIQPNSATIVSPVAGTIVMVAPTRHAVGIRSPFGEDILLHFGLDTVALNGEGMETLVKKGDQVAAGEALATVDWDRIRDRVTDTCVILVVTNSAGYRFEWLAQGMVEAGRTPLYRCERVEQ